MRADDMRLEIVEIDLDDAVEVALRVRVDLGIGAQELGVLVGEPCQSGAVRGLQVQRGAGVVREQGARRADLGTHVADRGLPGRGDRFRSGSEVLDDRAGAALDGEDAGHLEDDVLRCRPAGQAPGEADADQPRHTRVERPPGEDVDGVGPTHPDRDHPQAAGVGRVAVGPDHHPAGERVLLENDLMDDPRARLPEADAVLRRDGAEELVDLGVDVERRRHVALGADVRLDQVVAVHRRRHRDRGQPSRHELEQRHLRGRVLHRDAVGAIVGVVDRPLEADCLRIVGVRDQHLLREGHRSPEPAPPGRDGVRVTAVEGFDELDRGRRSTLVLGHRRPPGSRDLRLASEAMPSRRPPSPPTRVCVTKVSS